MEGGLRDPTPIDPAVMSGTDRADALSNSSTLLPDQNDPADAIDAKTLDDEDSEEESEEDDEGPYYRLHCRPFWSWISERVKKFEDEAIQSQKEAGLSKVGNHGPKGHQETDFEAFKIQWRQRFDLMRAERRELAAGDSSIAGNSPQLTSPPIRHMEIEILDDKMPHNCPCCLPEGDAHILIEASDTTSGRAGITEDRFLEAICDYLYGEDTILGQLPLRNLYQDGLILREWNYMLEGGGEFLIYDYKDQNRIWLYCIGQGEALSSNGKVA